MQPTQDAANESIVTPQTRRLIELKQDQLEDSISSKSEKITKKLLQPTQKAVSQKSVEIPLPIENSEAVNLEKEEQIVDLLSSCDDCSMSSDESHQVVHGREIEKLDVLEPKKIGSKWDIAKSAIDQKYK